MAAAPPEARGRVWPSTAIITAVIAALIGASCRGSGTPPLIVYPLPWLNPTLLRVAQPAIDAWEGPRAAELPESLMAVRSLPGGYAGEIAFAESMAALPGVVAAVGPQSSRATLLVAPIYTERGIPLLVPTATSDAVRALGPWVFQLAPANSEEGAFLATFAVRHLSARRITIFYLRADEYGLSLRQGVLAALGRLGIAPADEVGVIEETDIPRRVSASVRRVRPDVVIIAARGSQAAGIARAFHQSVPQARIVVGDGAPLGSGFVAEAGPAAAAVYGVAWWHPGLPDSASRAFATRYAQVAGAPASAADAMYYDAIMLAAQAVRDVGPHPAAIRRYLAELGTVRPPFHGVTGPISFAPQRPANLLTTRVEHGEVVVVTAERTP